MYCRAWACKKKRSDGGRTVIYTYKFLRLLFSVGTAVRCLHATRSNARNTFPALLRDRRVDLLCSRSSFCWLFMHSFIIYGGRTEFLRPRVCERRRPPLPSFYSVLLLHMRLLLFCFQFVGFVVLMWDLISIWHLNLVIWHSATRLIFPATIPDWGEGGRRRSSTALKIGIWYLIDSDPIN